VTAIDRIQPAALDDIERVRLELERTWAQPPGLGPWLRSVDHKSIGKRYIITAFVFFLLAGLEAATMRAQLARPENAVLGPDAYNQFFTMHGRRSPDPSSVPANEPTFMPRLSLSPRSRPW
jgi:hypothetical protein